MVSTPKKKWNGSKWLRKTTRKRLYLRDDHTCVYCARSIYSHTDIILTIDHVTPRELGGDNKHSNLVTACKSCNSAKRDSKLSDFIAYTMPITKKEKYRILNSFELEIKELQTMETNQLSLLEAAQVMEALKKMSVKQLRALEVFFEEVKFMSHMDGIKEEKRMRAAMTRR
jgi:hypothetical protein